ncbi:MAG: SprT-like domain-containing protein [Polyangiaceae bacterium]|jgi:predicted SprT family Zn-dependent metalloprotease
MANSDSEHELTASLERALLRELVAEWHRINAAYFRDGLSRPSVVLSSSTSHLGRWIGDTRVLELSRRMVLAQPWAVVIEVLRHEMAHQYVHEVLGETSETPHGPAFRAVCERLGVDPAASGLPRASASPHDDVTTRAVERIARLLALAESPNVHEAEAATLAAQRLMLKYNIDARTRPPTGYDFRTLGTPTGRVEESQRILAGILAQHFFVEVIWIPVYRPLEGKRGSVLEICGSRANLEIAEYVYGFLTHSCHRLWVDHKKAHGLRSNRERRTFQSGVMSGFSSKLAREAKKHRAEGLVWVKDGDLGDYFRRRHPHIRNVRYGGSPRSDAWHKGREAGERIVLRRGVGGAEGAAASRGKLLR